MVLQPAVQAAGIALMLILAGGLAYLSMRCLADERMAAASRAAEMRVEQANLDLQDAIAMLRDKLGVADRDQDQMQRRLAALSTRSGTLQKTAEPQAATHEPSQPGAPPLGRGSLDEIERVLASTGLHIKRLLTNLGGSGAEGGPFVPPPKSGALPDAISPQQLLALRNLAKTLPTSLPLADYRLTSGFGIRRDPFNRRAEFHTGIDLAAPYMTPVYATAPGAVAYVGWRGGYGKVVEIDLGNGITTRYAHLHRYTVLVGQRIAAHAPIGFVGSTGRSTGPHLHYEVLVNGKPQDPEKFIGLAGVISVAKQ